MIKQILLVVSYFIVGFILSTDISPLNSLWDSDAKLLFKIALNPIFFLIFSMFVVFAWCFIAYIIALIIKKDDHISNVYSKVLFPFKK